MARVFIRDRHPGSEPQYLAWVVPDATELPIDAYTVIGKRNADYFAATREELASRLGIPPDQIRDNNIVQASIQQTL